jgi:hypothetical protein
MPSSSNAIGNLEIPSLSLGPLNDRLRRIGQLLASGKLTSSTGLAGSSLAGQLEFTVPGILAIESDVCPVLTLPADQTFSELLAFVKSAPIGSPLTVQMYVGGTAWGPALSIAAGSKTAKASLTGNAKITADSIIRLDITGVGALLTGVSFPGSDLTVLIR